VFQNYALYPHMTVAQNMAFSLKLKNAPKTEIAEKVNRAAGILGLAQLLERYPRQLSGGQRQRVAMGRAIVRHPRAFLMDEPLSNLDAKLRVSMRAQLAQLHERLGVTTVYVTHDQVEAMTLGQRVAVLRDGLLQQCDTPQTLFHQPANLFVAAFIGSPSMNLVEAELAEGEVRFAGFALPLPAGKLPANGNRRIILGIRPTSLELAGPRTEQSLPRIRVRTTVVEELGDETHLIFPVDAPRVSAEAVQAAVDAESEDEGVLLADDTRALFTARVDAHRTVTSGETVELAVDVRKLHFFDRETGEALRAKAPAPIGRVPAAVPD
jgi:multiple sugar transport system ATP-binding protein